MAHSNVNAHIDPQLQFHDHSRHGSVSSHYHPLASGGEQRQPVQHQYQLHPAPQLEVTAAVHDDEGDEADSGGEDGSHASPEDTPNAG